VPEKLQQICFKLILINYEITYDTAMKSSGIGSGGGGARGGLGVRVHLQKFWFAENMGKIPENPGKNGTQRCLLQKMAPKVCRKNTRRPFVEVTP